MSKTTERNGKKNELNKSNRYRLSEEELETVLKMRGNDELVQEAIEKHSRVMIYDIETSRVTASIWGTGKQYINHTSLTSHTKIISIAWKWLGEDEVHWVKWDKKHCDKKLMKEFLKEYNKADMVIGQNNNSFDNKLVATRAAYHRLFVNKFIKSFDIYRQAKSVFRLASYSMAYMAKYFGLTLKQSHEGIHMWEMIEFGNKKEQEEYLKKMIDYNVGDIITTEELYLTLLPYLKPVMSTAVQLGNPSWACPTSGSTNVKLYRTTWTSAGTIQRIMYCKESKTQYKISNQNYNKFLQR